MQKRYRSVLLQNGALFTDLTVFENIATPLEGTHRTLPRRRDQGPRHVSQAGICWTKAGTEDLMPHSLSGGMERRVALARAVILNPKIVSVR